MESNHLVQDDHRVTPGYLTVRSHSLEPAPETPEARRSSSSAGSLSDRSADVSAWPTNRELPGDGESTACAWYLPRAPCVSHSSDTSGSRRRTPRPRRTAAHTDRRTDLSWTSSDPCTRRRAGWMLDSRSRST